MAGPAVIAQDTSLDKCLEYIVHTQTRISVNALVAHLAPDWDVMLDAWFKIHQKEILLWIAILTAAAKIVSIDDQFDFLANSISNTLLALHNNDRTSPGYTLYFKDIRLSDLKKPVLGRQLAVMREWVDLLLKSENATLQSYGHTLAQLVAQADTALAELKTANKNNYEFRLTGERKQFIDKVNALRQSSHGKIAELPHAKPELALPNTFAERFFKVISARTEDPVEAMTSKELVSLIAEKDNEVAALRTRLEEVLAAEAREAKASEERSAAKDDLAKMRAQAAELAAKMAELEKKLDSSS